MIISNAEAFMRSGTRNAIVAAATPAIAGLFIACGEDRSAPSEPGLEQGPTTVSASHVGTLHNDGLAHVFLRLRQAEDQEPLTAERMKEVVIHAVYEHMNAAGFSGITPQYVAAETPKWRAFVASEPDYSSLASAQSAEK